MPIEGLSKDEKHTIDVLDSESYSTETIALLLLQYRTLSSNVNTVSLEQYHEAFMDLEGRVRARVDEIGKP